MSTGGRCTPMYACQPAPHCAAIQDYNLLEECPSQLGIHPQNDVDYWSREQRVLQSRSGIIESTTIDDSVNDPLLYVLLQELFLTRGL